MVRSAAGIILDEKGARVAAIGIFDSGIGGLTVLKALRRALPEESFIYLGDTARLPYGTKSSRTIRHYLAQNIRFLRGLGVKAIVVACNSASSVLDSDRWENLPVYGVIVPGAANAAAATRNRRIGVLGTRATVGSGAYVRALAALDSSLHVIQQACPLLVPLVEEGWEGESVTRIILARYLESPLRQEIDTLILGCTHYPVLKPAIQSLVSPEIRLVDSAEAVARGVCDDLERGLFAAADQVPMTQIWTTDLSDAFRSVGERILGSLRVNDWRLADIR